MKPFTIVCNKCKSTNVHLFGGYDGDVNVMCDDCENSCDSLELIDFEKDEK